MISNCQNYLAIRLTFEEKAPPRDHSQDGAFSVVDQSEHFTAKPPLKK